MPTRKDKEKQFACFLGIFKRLQINIPFSEVVGKMTIYAKFMKELLNKKNNYMEEDTIQLEARSITVIQKSLYYKHKDPRSFTIPSSIGNLFVGKALLHLGASINLMALSMLNKVEDVEIDVAPCGACRPWIFFINGFLCFLRSDCSGMEKEKDEWRRHFK